MSAVAQNIPGCVLAVAEHRQGRLSTLTLELAQGARLLANELGLDARLAVLDRAPLDLARQAAAETGLDAWAVAIPGLDGFSGEAYRLALTDLARVWGAQVILGAHSTSGLDWAPGLAGRLGAEFLGAVEGVERRQGELLFARSALGGKAIEWWAAPTPLVLTLQPGAFAVPDSPPAAPGRVVEMASPPLNLRGRVLGLAGEGDEEAGLERAQVVVAAGRGIGQPENLELIRRMAGLFSQAATAGSRPICDLGWLPYRCQVGMTGATVAPKLYIACGISGASQHTVGMQGAGFIVAVCSDPHAAIFNLADVGVVEDLTVFIPALLELAEGAS